MKAQISYSAKVPFWQVAFGLLCISSGIFLVITKPNFFVITPLIAAYFLLKSEGSEIDLASKTYRKTISVLGIKFGKWQPLDDPAYISVFNTTEDLTVRIVTAETTNSQPIILLNLFMENHKKITIYKTQNGKEAFDIASHIADALTIDFLDATEKGHFQWVDQANYQNNGQISHVD